MRSGCIRLLGLVVAIGCGALSATRADAGFTDQKPPSPGGSQPTHQWAGTGLSHRSTLQLKLESTDRTDGSATAVDLPNPSDFKSGQKPDAEDHLVARLLSDRNNGKPSYSLFWEDSTRNRTDAGLGDLGVDVKAAAPVVVPLPPGVWAGLIGLLCVIWFQVRRHRRQLI